MILSTNFKSNLKLPITVTGIDLYEEIIQYDEQKHLLHIKALVDGHFKKRSKYPQTPSELRQSNGWKEVGIKPEALPYKELEKRIRAGKPFHLGAWIPNDKIWGNIIHNRTAEINFTSISNNLDARGGLYWQAMHITVVVYPTSDGGYKFVTVIGNHCTVKSILVCGLGAMVKADVVFLGDSKTQDDAKDTGSVIHHTDSDRRTNMSADNRLISGVHSGEAEYQEIMKILVAMGLQMKDQIIGDDNWEISSYKGIVGLVKEYNFDTVNNNVELIKETWPKDNEISYKALEVMSNITFYFGDIVCDSYWKEFMKWFATGHSQADIYPNSQDNKNSLIPTMAMIRQLNVWLKSKGVRKQALIGTKTFTHAIPADKLVNVPVLL